MYYAVIFLIAVLGESRAFLFGGPDWDGLAVTWGPNPLSGVYFDQMPRTEAEATKAGWTKISDCQDYEIGSPDVPQFFGKRYILHDDTAVMLLYGKNGHIAGIQQGVPKGMDYPYEAMKYWNIYPYDAEKELYLQTAYFVEPTTICSQGRTAAQYEEQGTGTNLYLQWGADGSKSVLIPRKESDIGTTNWTKGKCFVTMGQHYWFNVTRDMNCDDFFPAFIMYNKGKLNSFGWAIDVNLASERYEHPPDRVLSKFFQVVPQCFFNRGTRSTMHIYMDNHPMLNFC